jgi:indole-3-glycerol phosphate synthase
VCTKLILDDILQHKRGEVERRKAEQPLAEVKAMAAAAPRARNFASAIRRGCQPCLKIIAEVKKASPSKGIIREDFNPVEIAMAYEANGASAISVLTDEKFFQGSLQYLIDVKSAVSIPVLRKDFVIDEYQVYEGRAAGADAILLIAAALSDEQMSQFRAIASDLEMGCLVEVHDAEEMRRADAVGARVIGVNNRDLRTFHTDISTSADLFPLAPPGSVLVSESGINSREDMLFLANSGAHAVLIGESLMRADDIGAKLRELVLP